MSPITAETGNFGCSTRGSRRWSRLTRAHLRAGAIAPPRPAETYLRENPDRPVSVGELCLETGALKRTLMLGFHEAFGISPGAYHRRLRLERGTPRPVKVPTADVTVAQVALRWGFEHLGRFSVDYRNLFGEAPATTLRG